VDSPREDSSACNMSQNVRRLSYSIRYFRSILSDTGVCRRILIKFPNIKFHKNSFSGSRFATSEETDTTKLIGAFFQLLFANAGPMCYAVSLFLYCVPLLTLQKLLLYGVLVHVCGVRQCLWTAATNGPIVYPPDDKPIRVWRPAGWYWQGKTKELEEKPVPVPLWLLQIRSISLHCYKLFISKVIGYVSHKFCDVSLKCNAAYMINRRWEPSGRSLVEVAYTVPEVRTASSNAIRS
jgi:hypothetical protein